MSLGENEELPRRQLGKHLRGGWGFGGFECSVAVFFLEGLYLGVSSGRSCPSKVVFLWFWSGKLKESMTASLGTGFLWRSVRHIH